MNWVKLSLLKLQGVQGLDIMFDGDEAGRQAAEQAKFSRTIRNEC